MDSPKLLPNLNSIEDRLQVLEALSGQQDPKMSQHNGPHDEVPRGTILRQSLTTLSDTTLCALQLPCGMPPPLGQMTDTESNKLKYAKTSQTSAPRRSHPDSKHDQTPIMLTREEERRIRDDTNQGWRTQQQSNVQATASYQEHACKKAAWTEKGKDAQSTSIINSM